jgi:hypothetical protein
MNSKISKSDFNDPVDLELSPEIKFSAMESERNYWKLRHKLLEKYSTPKQDVQLLIDSLLRDSKKICDMEDGFKYIVMNFVNKKDTMIRFTMFNQIKRLVGDYKFDKWCELYKN